MRYKDYNITFDPPPIPTRKFDWQFVHVDYDGAEDALDFRCGSAENIEACKSEIDFIEG